MVSTVYNLFGGTNVHNLVAKPRKFLPIVLVLMGILVSGCAGSGELTPTKVEVIFRSRILTQSAWEASPPTELTEGTYSVASQFAEFYAVMGGIDVLGPVISPLFESGNLKEQYVQAGLMVFDETATSNERFRLAPLGLKFDVSELGTPVPTQPGDRIIDGRLIPVEFLILYEKLGGARYVGRPLTEARFNPEKRRTEQYFENLGFYRLNQDPPGVGHLMAYGAFACDKNCRAIPPKDSIPGQRIVLPEPFESKAQHFGAKITGRLLVGPHRTEDDRQAVIFENLVIVVDRNQPGGVMLLPIVEQTGFLAQPFVREDKNPLTNFYRLEGDLGHNVPIIIDDFLDQFGGIEVSGLPISEISPLSKDVYQQCFANLCVELNLNLPAGEQLSLSPMGQLHKEMVYDPVQSFSESQSLDNIVIKLWEDAQDISKNESQTIYVAIFENGVTLMNREPVLIIELPDGTTRQMVFPPSDVEGKSSLQLEPVSAPPLTLIEYQVCLYDLVGNFRCFEDNFMVEK